MVRAPSGVSEERLRGGEVQTRVRRQRVLSATAGTPAELSAGGSAPSQTPIPAQYGASLLTGSRAHRAGSSKYSLVLLELADEGQDLGRIMHRVLWHSAAAAGCGDGDPSGSSTALKGGSCSPTQPRERSIWLCQLFCL